MAWALFILYLIGTSYLGYLGSKKTKDFDSFAIGDGKMSPWVVGITLAASTASAATFIVNPGFVYVHGLSAFLHLGVSVFVGILFMLYIASYRFRKIGVETDAVTIPGWLGKRYKSTSFAIYFSIVNLFSFAFLVLLVGGISIVMQPLLGISNTLALIITIGFVSLYVIIGGTYAHVFTNVLQGSLMVIVSLLIIGSGIVLSIDQPDLWTRISEIDLNLAKHVNPESNLYNSFFSVYVSGFLIGIALVCQPHILTKALYVKSDKDVSRYLVIFAVVYILFTCLLLAGFWALVTVPEELLLDSTTGAFRQDLVMTRYLAEAFPPWLFTIISIVLLAAAMSTLDGLMVGLSTILANDLFVNVFKKINKDDYTEAQSQKLAFKTSHLVLIILGIIAFVVAYNPPKLLGIFGQFGVYALVISSLAPLLMGMYYNKPSIHIAWGASLLALACYTLLYFYGDSLLPIRGLAFDNPAVPAAIAILISCIPALLISQLIQNRN